MRSQVTAQVNVAQAKMLRQDRRGNFFERFWRQNHEKASQRGANMAWGARVALRRPSRNRLKIGAPKEGTVSDDILES